MPIQYLTNDAGETVAVQIPIEEWRQIAEKYAGAENLPQWQKHLIDQRLDLFKNHPDQVVSMEDFEKLLAEDETV